MIKKPKPAEVELRRKLTACGACWASGVKVSGIPRRRLSIATSSFMASPVSRREVCGKSKGSCTGS